MSRFSEYFKKKIVRPDKDGGCPPGTILTDEGCLPTGRRKSPRGFQDPEFPVYCGLEKEIPCLPDRDFSEPDPPPLPLPPPPPGKGTPQGSAEVFLECPSADGVVTEGSITVPANFFVRIPEYSNDPAINASNAADAKAAADADAQSFAEDTLRCIHFSEAVSAECPAVSFGEPPLAGSAKSLPAGYLRKQVPYLDSPAPAEVASLTEDAQNIVDSSLQCYRESAASSISCSGVFGGLQFTDGGGKTLATMEDRTVSIPAGRVRQLVDIDPASPTYLEPSQATVDGMRDDAYIGQLQCRLLSAEVSVTCPLTATITLNDGTTAQVPPIEPKSYTVAAGRATKLLPYTGGGDAAAAQADASVLYAEAESMLSREFTCFYGNTEETSGCPAPAVEDQDDVYLHPSSTGSNIAANIVIKAASGPGGKFSSEEADNAAQAAYTEATGNLTDNCIYANLEVADPCFFQTNLHNSSRTGKALEGEIVQQGGYDNIVTQAESLAATRKQCRYFNDPKSGNCGLDLTNFVGNIGEIAGGTIVAPSLNIANNIAQAAADAATVCLYMSDKQKGDCGWDLVGFVGTIGEVPEYEIVAPTRAVANSIAQAAADAATVCLFENDPRGGRCDADEFGDPILDGFVGTIGRIDEGEVTAPTRSVANKIAEALAAAATVCLFENDTQTGSCPGGSENFAGTIGNIPEGEVIAPTRALANNIAQAAADAATVCLYTNDKQKGDCIPDDEGFAVKSALNKLRSDDPDAYDQLAQNLGTFMEPVDPLVAFSDKLNAKKAAASAYANFLGILKSQLTSLVGSHHFLTLETQVLVDNPERSTSTLRSLFSEWISITANQPLYEELERAVNSDLDLGTTGGSPLSHLSSFSTDAEQAASDYTSFVKDMAGDVANLLDEDDPLVEELERIESGKGISKDTPGFAGNIATVKSGSVTAGSRSAANTIAEALANATTVCLFNNTPKSGVCTTPELDPDGNPVTDPDTGEVVEEPVTNDTPGFAGNIAEVEAGAVTAASFGAANANAQAAADAGTICLFGNEKKSGVCTTPELDSDGNPVIDPDTGKPVEELVTNDTPGFAGNIAEVEAGAVTAASFATANNQAQAAADAGTLCLFYNDEKSGSCGTTPKLDPDGNPVTDPDTGEVVEELVTNDTSGFEGNIVTVAAKSLVATTRELANTTAQASADASTICLYSNTNQGEAFCDETDVGGDDIDYFASIPGIVEVGTVQSSISITDANTRAQGRAESQKVCVAMDDVEFDSGAGFPGGGGSGGDCSDGTVDASLTGDPCVDYATRENDRPDLLLTPNITAQKQDAGGNWSGEAVANGAEFQNAFNANGLPVTLYVVATYAVSGAYRVATDAIITTDISDVGDNQEVFTFGHANLQTTLHYAADADPAVDDPETICYLPVVTGQCPMRLPRLEIKGDFKFYFLDDATLASTGNEVTLEDVLQSYNPDNHTNWSIHFPVSGDKIDTVTGISYDDDASEYDGDASADAPQNYYHLPIVRDGKLINTGGIYRENTFCAGNKGPIVEMIRKG